jgi:hypothetical protein
MGGMSMLHRPQGAHLDSLSIIGQVRRTLSALQVLPVKRNICAQRQRIVTYSLD